MTSNSSSPVVVDIDGAIARVRLVRPAKRNALSDEMVGCLREIFSTLPDAVNVAVLHGEGEAFCAGLDLSELAERSAAEGMFHSRMWHAAFEKIEFGRVPVISVLHGAVIGGGLELACSTHIRVAEHGAFFALPEGQRGLFVGGGGSVRIQRVIGTSRMMDMMLTGRVYDSAEGERSALAHYRVPDGQGLEFAMTLASKIAGNAPLSNFAIMHALPRIGRLSSDEGLFAEAMIAGIAQSDPAAKDRMERFLSGRAAKVGKG
jgi:(methylthio)acryloyl-CoA hydratase